MKVLVVTLSVLIALPLLILGTPEASVATIPDGDVTGSLLNNPNIRLRPAARGDIENGLVDSRVLQLLVIAAEHHSIVVGPFVTGHSYYVAGTTRPSNHSFGRAVDIAVVDGLPVSLSNLGARDVVETFGNLLPELRPTEIGSPWLVSFPKVSAIVSDHHDHLHAGYRH